MASMKRMLLVLAALIVVAAVAMIVKIGPRNLTGMLFYDQRREGDLKVGDRAPEAKLVALDGRTTLPLLNTREKPTVVVFGSFT